MNDITSLNDFTNKVDGFASSYNYNADLHKEARHLQGKEKLKAGDRVDKNLLIEAAYKRLNPEQRKAVLDIFANSQKPDEQALKKLGECFQAMQQARPDTPKLVSAYKAALKLVGRKEGPSPTDLANLQASRIGQAKIWKLEQALEGLRNEAQMMGINCRHYMENHDPRDTDEEYAHSRNLSDSLVKFLDKIYNLANKERLINHWEDIRDLMGPDMTNNLKLVLEDLKTRPTHGDLAGKLRDLLIPSQNR